MSMLQWFKQRQRGGRSALPAAPVDNSQAELEFLRGQADFDAEEMASVRRVEPSTLEPERGTAPKPSAAWEVPGAARIAEPWLSETPATAGHLVLAVIIERHSALATIRDNALIGREDPEEDIRPEVDLSADDAVSRRHARIYRRGGQFFIQELGSTNGTCLNGEWVIPGRDEPLKTGDIILLGEASELQVLAVSFGTELTAEDRQIGALLSQVLSDDSSACTEDWGGGRGRGVHGAPLDVLDVALSRGVEAGLLEHDPEWDMPMARPEWRVRDFEGLELPSLVEPYR